MIRVTIDSIIGDEPLSAPFLIRLLGDKAGSLQSLRQALWVPGIVLIASTAFRGLFVFLRGRLAAQASENIAKSMREKIYDHLQRLPYSYHKHADTGDLMQRCTSDVDTVRRFLGSQLVEVGNALFLLTSVSLIMLSLDGRMTLISLGAVPFIFTFAFVFFRKVKTSFKQAEEAEAALTTVLQENLTGMRVVRAFANQDYEIEKFSAKNEIHRQKSYRLIWLLACYWSASDFLVFFQIGLVIALGAYYTALGELSIGTMIVFSTYIGMLLWPVRQLGRVLTDLGKALVAAERLQEILDTPKEELVQTAAQPILRGEIVFEKVCFRYEPGPFVLEDLSFKAEAGQTIAVLGPTGSGKSSLVHLLARLYDYEKGSITIDGQELKTIDKKWMRKNVAVVPQEPFLFAKSIRDNITLAQDNVPEEELYQICQEAAIHEVILQFDQGYDTLVGERGVSLSGGQRQRIAIARALLAHCPILIFDDSLSAVDTETDLAIRNALKTRRRQATTFLISHRITSLAGADLILVLENGRIVQRGTHRELLAAPGPYARIWQLQSSPKAQYLTN